MGNLSSLSETIKERLSITEIVGRDVRLARRGNDFLGLCPFHHEKTPSFTVSAQKGTYHCYGCGVHGDVISYVMSRRHISFKEAVADLARELGLSVEPVQQQHQDLYKILNFAMEWYETQLKKTTGETARVYLERRHLSAETIAFFRLGMAPSFHQGEKSLYQTLREKKYPADLLFQTGLFVKSEKTGDLYDRFRGRLMFPIMDTQNRVIAFGGRTLDGGQPKYLNSSDTPVFHKGKTLYNYSNAKSHVNRETPLILVEGFFDVISLYQAGYNTAVAPLGTAFTADQLDLLWKRSDNPILCFDGDRAGQKAAFRAAEKALPLITAQKTLLFCLLPEGEDPDSLIQNHSSETVQALLNKRISLIDLIWEFVLKKQGAFKTLTPEKKAAFKEELVHLSQTIENKDIQYFYQKDLVNRFYMLTRQKDGYVKDVEKITSKLPTVKGRKNDQLWQKILLAILAKHPKLIAEVFERLAEISFNDPVLDNFRNRLLDEATDRDHITLSESESKKLFDAQTRLHAAFLESDMSDAEAFEKWDHIWQHSVLNVAVKRDSEVLTQQMKKDLDKKLWERLKALKTGKTD